MIYTFESYELDEPSFELRRRGALVKLEPKVFDVLRHLVANRDRVVTKTAYLFLSSMNRVARALSAARFDEAREEIEAESDRERAEIALAADGCEACIFLADG